MLWWRFWLESRARFLLFLCGAAVVCAVFIRHTQAQALPDTSPVYYTATFFWAHQNLTGIWILAAVLLGMGGLVRERALGTAPFTLALPITRQRVAWLRIVVGLLQVTAMAVLPWLVIYGVAWWGGKPVQPAQAFYYIALLLGAGIVYFALAVLIASLVDGEYTAPAVTFGVVFGASFLPGIIDKLRPFSVLRLMSGNASIDRKTYLLTSPLPWESLAVTCGVAAVFLALSVQAARHREF